MTEQHARYIADYVRHELENGLDPDDIDSQVILAALWAINSGPQLIDDLAMEGYTPC